MKNVLQRGNRFNLEQPKFIMNSLWCNFRKGQTRLHHELQFFRKSCKKWILWATSEREKYTIVGNHFKTPSKKAPRKRNKIWLKKQLDFYVILTMLAYEVSMSKFLWVMYEMPPTCFYLKRSFIRKLNKSELTNELKNMITKNIPTHLLPVIDYRFHDSC